MSSHLRSSYKASYQGKIAAKLDKYEGLSNKVQPESSLVANMIETMKEIQCKLSKYKFDRRNQRIFEDTLSELCGLIKGCFFVEFKLKKFTNDDEYDEYMRNFENFYRVNIYDVIDFMCIAPLVLQKLSYGAVQYILSFDEHSFLKRFWNHVRQSWGFILFNNESYLKGETGIEVINKRLGMYD